MPHFSRYTGCTRTQLPLGRMYSYFGKGEFHGKNAGVSLFEAICAKRRYVIFMNFTHLLGLSSVVKV